jgi:hypothetical protein
MYETIIYAISQLIYHVYMVAVIAFVALQFGYVRKPNASEQKDDQKKDVSLREVPAGQPNLSAIMGGLFEQMAPQFENLMGGSLKGMKNVPKKQEDATPIVSPMPEETTEQKEQISFE